MVPDDQKDSKLAIAGGLFIFIILLCIAGGFTTHLLVEIFDWSWDLYTKVTT